MGNLMTSLWVGVSGLQVSQNAINTTSHNLANVGTKGYVRQQIVLKDFSYTTVGQAANYSNRVGLGVATEVVRQVRDQFFDERYRKEIGRQGYYESQYKSVNEVEDIFGELEGVSFQVPIHDMQNAIQEMAKTPNDPVARATFVKKAEAFLERAQKISEQLKSYQDNLNTQISDKVNRINFLGEQIRDLNMEIKKFESSGLERANDLRDARNVYLDELGQLVDITYYEDVNGVVNVMAEGNVFVDETIVFKMSLTTEKPNLKQVNEISNDIYKLNQDIKQKTLDNLTAVPPDTAGLDALVKKRDDSLKLLDRYIDFTVSDNGDGTIQVNTSEGILVNGVLKPTDAEGILSGAASSVVYNLGESVIVHAKNISQLNDQIKKALNAGTPITDPTVAALIKQRDDSLAEINKIATCTTTDNGDGTIDVSYKGDKLVIGKPNTAAVPPEKFGIKLETVENIRKDIKDELIAEGNKMIQLNEDIKAGKLAGTDTTALEAQLAATAAGLSKYVDLEIRPNFDGSSDIYVRGGGLFVPGDVNDKIGVDKKVAESICSTSKMLKPIWAFTGEDVFNFDTLPSSAINTDIGSLKGLLISRGSDQASYVDIPMRDNYGSDIEYLRAVEFYNTEIQSSVICTAQAQFDQYIHGMVTALNNIFSPNKEIELADGTKITVLDKEKAPVGMDENHTMGEELFKRKGVDRYETVTVTVFQTDAAGNKIEDPPGSGIFLTEDIEVRKYNEENPDDPGTLYTLGQLEINKEILKDYSKLAMTSNKDLNAFDADVIEQLLDLYDKPFVTLGPNNSITNTYGNYYNSFTSEMANRGETLKRITEYQQNSVEQIDSTRINIMGVASDEELTNLIKFQHSYSAASRYINVVSDMLEHIVTRL